MTIKLSEIADEVVELVFENLSFTQCLTPEDFSLQFLLKYKILPFKNSNELYDSFLFRFKEPITSTKKLHQEICDFFEQIPLSYKRKHGIIIEELEEIDFHLCQIMVFQ